jgi:hypothetical protein
MYCTRISCRGKKWANLEADGAAVVELAGGAVVLAHAAHQLVRVVLHTGSGQRQKRQRTLSKDKVNRRGVPLYFPVFRIRIRIESVQWIRIRFRFGIRIQEGKMTHKNRKIKKFHVLKCGIFSFEGRSFFCSLDVLYGGLGIGKL